MDDSTKAHIIDQAVNLPSTHSFLESSPSPVHWQSAFWGVAIVAFNTMVQDSGDFCFFPAKYQLFLRSSPILCALDSILIIFKLVVRSYSTNPLKALRVVAESRNFQEFESEDRLRMSTWLVLWMVRVLALLQVLKIFGLQGVPWTQVFTAMYLTSYVLVETLGQFRGPISQNLPMTVEDNQLNQPSQKWVEITLLSMVYIALGGQLAIWIIYFFGWFPSFESLTSDFSRRNSVYLILCLVYIYPSFYIGILIWLPFLIIPIIIDILLFLLPSFLIMLLAYPMIVETNIAMYLFRSRSDFDRRICIGTICFIGASLITFLYLRWLTPHFLSMKLDFGTPVFEFIFYGLTFQIIECLLALVVIAGALLVLLKLLSTRTVAAYMPSGYKKYLTESVWVSLYFLFLNFATALIYYSCTYKETGTFKPAWTEYLG